MNPLYYNYNAGPYFQWFRQISSREWTYLKEAEVLAWGDGDGELRLGPPGAQAAGGGGALFLSRAHPNPPGLPLPLVPLET